MSSLRFTKHKKHSKHITKATSSWSILSFHQSIIPVKPFRAHARPHSPPPPRAPPTDSVTSRSHKFSNSENTHHTQHSRQIIKQEHKYLVDYLNIPLHIFFFYATFYIWLQYKKGRKVDRTRGTEECKWMSFWWSYREKTLAAFVHTRSHRFFSQSACRFSASHTCVQVLSLSAFAHSVSHSWRTNNPSPYHSQLSKKADRFHPWKGEKRQHPPSNTVYAEWSCALWWQSIYTWEEGNWYWDPSNIAANEGLLPGKLEKRWWTVEEIYEGLTIKNVEGKKLQKTQLKWLSTWSIFKCTVFWGHWNGKRCSDMWAFWNNAWQSYP